MITGYCIITAAVFIARQHSNADARYWYRNSVRPSVCLSRSGIVPRRLNVSSCFFTLQPHRSSFPLLNIFAKFFNFLCCHLTNNVEYIIPHTECRWSVYILRFSTNIWLYVGNNRTLSHGTLIGNHRCSIELWHSRWPWVTFEGHFDDLLTVVILCAQLKTSRYL